MIRFVSCVVLIALAGLLVAMPLHAALTDRYWNNTGTSGDFNAGDNWDIDLPPNANGTGPLMTGDTGYINNGGTANISADVVPVLQWLYIGQGESTSGTVKQTSGSMTLNGSIRSIGGGGGNGTYIMEGGSLTANALGTDGLQYANYTNPFWGIGTGTASVGAMTMKNNATVNSTGGVRVGDTGGTGTFEMFNDSVLNQSGHFFVSTGVGGVGTMTLHDSAAVNTTTHAFYGGFTLIGQGGGSTGILNVLDSAKWTTNTGGNLYVGRADSTGTLNIASASTENPATVTVGGTFHVAHGETAGIATGTVNMTGTARLVTNASSFVGHSSGHGEVNMSGQTQWTNIGDFQVANGEGMLTPTVGIVNLTNNATINQTGYVLLGAFANTTATMTLGGDSKFIQSGGQVWIGYYLATNGTLTLNDNASFENTGSDGTTIGSATGTGVLNLNGGVFATTYLRGTANGTVNFMGGTLRATADEANWLGANVIYKVGTAGAKIDTNFNVQANGSLIENPASTGGGLIKMGTGMLTLAAANSYTGMTNVNAGTLRIAHAGALPGPATINTDATLSLAATMEITGKILGSTGNVSVDAGNVTYGSNAFSGTMIANGGNLILNATHSGNAFVNTGASWYHTGTGTVSGLTTVGVNGSSQDALLGGTGTLGDVKVLHNWGNSLGMKGGLEAGQNGSGSLKMANLTFNGSGFVYIGNATLGIGAYTGSNAAIVASGGLTLGAELAGTVQFDLGSANIASGTYHLIQHNGAINYLNGSSPTDFQIVNGVLSARQTTSIVDNAGSGSTRYLDYVVTGAYPIWSGLVGSTTNNNWTANNHAVTNWKANTNGSAFYFIDSTDPAATGGIGDAVLFNDAAGTAHSTVTIPANVAPISVTVDNTMTYTFNGPGGIVDGPSMTKTTLLKKNTGILVLNTPNTYSGGTTINEGTIRVGNQTALGAGGVTFFPNAPATAKLQLFGNSVSLSGLTTDAVAPGTPVVENGGGGDATLTLTNATANTYAGLLQDGAAGKLGVTFAGSGKFTLSGVNTYSGDTTLSDYGSLAIGIDNALPHGAGKGNLVFVGGSLDLNGHNLTVNGLSNPGATVAITNNLPATTATLAIGDGNTDSDFSGAFVDNGTGIVALAKIGVGRLALNDPGTTWSNYSGGTTLSAGTIQTGYAAALGTGSLSMTNGATLDLYNNLNVGGLSGEGFITTSSGGSPVLTVTSAATANTAFTGLIQNGNGTLGFAKAGAGTLTLASANTYTGVTSFNGGTLVVPTLANGGVISSIGQSTADPANLVFNGGTLYYPGPSIVLDRGFTTNGGQIKIDNNVTIQGTVTSTTVAYRPITYKTGAGTLTFQTPDASPTFHNLGYDVNYNEFWIQQGKAVFDGLTGTEYKSWWVNVGVDPVGVYNQGGPATVGTPELLINNVTLTTGALGWGYGGNAVVNMTGTSKVTCAAYALLGYATPGTVTQSTVNMNDTASITTVANFLVGCNGANTTGTLTLNNSANIVSGSNTYIGANHATATGTLTMNNNSFITSAATVWVGYNGGTGNLTLRDDSYIAGNSNVYFGLQGISNVELRGNSHVTGAAGNFINGANAATANAVLTMYDQSYITTPGVAYIGSNGTGTATLNGTSYITAGSHVHVGNGSNGNGTLILNGGATTGPTLTSTGGNIYIGENFAGALLGTGVATISGASTINCTNATNGIFLVGYNKGIGSLTQGGTSTINARRIYYGVNAGASGTVVMNENAVTNVSADVLLGYSASTGTITLNNNAKMTIGTLAYVGAFGGTGTVNLNGPTAQFAATTIQVGHNWNTVANDTTGRFNVNGTGALATASEIILGSNGGQGAVWNQNAGQTTVASKFVIGEFDYSDVAANRTAGSGTLNLSGGVVTTPVVTTRSVVTSTNAADVGTVLHGATSGTVNFNGGTLQASGDSTDFIATDDPLASMTLKVQKNATSGLGAVIDSQGFAITIAKDLQHDAAGPAIDGGLSKLGSGSLVLTGALTYTGNTNVAAGTLQISTPGAVMLSTITGAGTLKVTDATTLNATSIMVGTLTIGGTPPAAAAAAVPEPGTLVLLALAGLGVLFAAWRRK